MNVAHLFNPGETIFPPNICRTAAAKKAQRRARKQKQTATKGKAFQKHVRKYNLMEEFANAPFGM